MAVYGTDSYLGHHPKKMFRAGFVETGTGMVALFRDCLYLLLGSGEFSALLDCEHGHGHVHAHVHSHLHYIEN